MTDCTARESSAICQRAGRVGTATARVVVLAAALALGGCGVLTGAADEIAVLVALDGERVLRDPMRPIRDRRRVLILAIDGVGEQRLAEALAAGDMPQLARFLGAHEGGGVYERAYRLEGVPSVFPAETAAAWTATYTGVAPAVSGVPGNEWFDRDSAAITAPIPVATGSVEPTLEIWSADLLGRIVAAPTLFERAGVRAHVSMGFPFRGADLLTPPDLDDLDDLGLACLGAVFGGRDEVYEAFDDDSVEGVVRGAEQYGLPDLQVAFFPGVDLVTHGGGAAAERAYLRDEIDCKVGALLDLYRARGVLDRTTVLLVSDHGHAGTVPDDRHSLVGEGADEPPALLDSLGYRVHGGTLDAGRDDANVAMAANDAVAFLTVANGASCVEGDALCDWSLAPSLDHDVLPLARALRRAADGPRTGVGGLAGAIDLILVRSSDPSGRTSPPFRVLHEGEVVDVAEYLRRVPRPDLVAFERRVRWLTEGPLGHRAGDVLLLAKSGPGWPLDERFYFAPPRASGHGGASTSESLISLVVARAGTPGARLRDEVRAAVGDRPTQLDLVPLVLAFLR